MADYLITIGDDGSLTIWTPAVKLGRGELGSFSRDIAGAAVKAQAKVPIVLASRPKGGPS